LVIFIFYLALDLNFHQVCFIFRSDHLAKHVRRHTNVANGGSAGNQNQSNPNQQPTKITIAHTTPMQAVGQGTSAVLANSPISQQGKGKNIFSVKIRI